MSIRNAFPGTTMPFACPRCQRANPPEAAYCYHDGTPLPAAQSSGPVGAKPFPSPFAFPSGRRCRTFDELARACLDHWDEARGLLTHGAFDAFLGALGRADLAAAARQAATFPDPDRGLDQFLTALPARDLGVAQLRVEPASVNLGMLRPGQDQQFSLRLTNDGGRLLYGTLSCEGGTWLTLGRPGGREGRFKCRPVLEVAVHVPGDQLRAGPRALEAQLVIDSSGGSAVVPVCAEVRVQPFPAGALRGALSPRQLAEKAKAQPQGAAALFERGAVAEWYRANGWVYPVQGPTSSGLGAVQQFFEALGLVKPPRLNVSPSQLELSGAPGETLCVSVQAETAENRPIYLHGKGDQPWLRAEPAILQGRVAAVPVFIDVPPQPGERRAGALVLAGNGNQRFRIPVTVTASGSLPAPAPAPAPRPEPAPRAAESAGGGFAPARSRRLVHLAPTALLAVVVAALLVGDALLPNQRQVAPPTPGEEPVHLDPEPWVAVQLHDAHEGQWSNLVPPPLRGTFGLRVTRQGKELAGKRLMFDPWGRTNNVCLRVDGKDALLGDPAAGHWDGEFRTSWAEEGQQRHGFKGVWQLRRAPVRVTQLVNVVPGQIQRSGGQLWQHQDTCLVRYRVENQGEGARQVGLRFLLDTFIGANDGVPFVVPGRAQTCNTFLTFPDPEDVPEYILALEKDDPQSPGTVANLRFRVPGAGEAPDRVTLGAWPNWLLPGAWGVAQGHRTGWEVPVASMQAIAAVRGRAGESRDPDSAVTLYWRPRRLDAGQVRVVGFAYGLGQVAGDAAPGQLRVLGGGKYPVGAAFTLQALVRNPAAGQSVTLQMPAGLELVRGPARQEVPPLPAGAARPESTVSWTVKGTAAGTRILTVHSSNGVEQQVPVVLRAQVGIFD